MYVDTHCHLFNEYYKELDKLINFIKPNIIIVSGVDYETNKEVVELCNRHNNVYGTLGHHPSCVNSFSEEALNYIKKNIKNPKVVGIGEIGLDYHWIQDNKLQQQQLLINLLDVALIYKKPIVIHSRDALEDTYNILGQQKYKNIKKIMHCYSYDLNYAKKFVDIGAMLGISGVITFKNNSLKEIVKNIDLQHLLLETDSPYLTPAPYRGIQNNPSYIPLVAEEMAHIKKMSVNHVLNVTTKNALSQFDIIKQS